MLAAGRAEEVITAENINKSYGVSAAIYRHPLHGVLQVSVVKGREMQGKKSEGPPVHIIGGGEEALPLLEMLLQEGCRLSIGPVSAQDSGCRFAHFHGLPVVIVPPFTAMNTDHIQEHFGLLNRAEAVVVPPIQFGEGNLSVLEAVGEVLDSGKAVYIVDPEGAAGRDHSGGKADAALKQMIARGAVALKDAEKLPGLICQERRDSIG